MCLSVYVTKNSVADASAAEANCCSDEKKGKIDIYQASLVQLREAASDEDREPVNRKLPSKPLDLGIERSVQIVVQFLYRSKDQPGDNDRFLVLIHHECECCVLKILVIFSFTTLPCLHATSSLSSCVPLSV